MSPQYEVLWQVKMRVHLSVVTVDGRKLASLLLNLKVTSSPELTDYGSVVLKPLLGTEVMSVMSRVRSFTLTIVEISG